jgi:retinol dehydrogenase-12
MEVYARAKLEMLMCGYALARQLTGTGVTVNTVHPGITGTKIVDAISSPAIAPLVPLVKRLLLTPEQGAHAALDLATNPWLEKTTGKYFLQHVQARSPELSYDTALQDQLWKASADLVSLPTRRPQTVH